MTADSCRSANAILVCQVPLHEQAGPEWGVDDWKEVDKVHERPIFKSLSWLTERVRNDSDFTEWQEVTLSKELHRCNGCAPTPPQIKWKLNQKKKIIRTMQRQSGTRTSLHLALSSLALVQ